MLTIVIRPEPGAAVTLARLHAAGIAGLSAPLFAAQPLAWDPPAPSGVDRLLLTSANALRHAGPALDQYRSVPCACVGPATADAARRSGLTVAFTGDSDAATLLAAAHAPGVRWLWLVGAPHQMVEPPSDGTLAIVPVYAMIDLPVPEALERALGAPAIVLAHSAAAARRLRQLVADPALHHLIAISDAAAQAAGRGWRSISAATSPDDREMVALAACLCEKARHE